MASRKLLFEIGSKKIYESDSDDHLMQTFTDNIVAGSADKKAKIKGKGVINNAISSYLFEYLESYHVMTHFISKASEKEMLVKKVEYLPIEVVIHNVATTGISKRFKLENGLKLSNAIIEIYYDNENLKYPMVNESHLLALGVSTQEQISSLMRAVPKINAILKSFFERRGIEFVSCNLRFGKYKGHVVLADEISPDTCRFWDVETKEKLDLDRFHQNLGKVEEAYNKIHERIIGEN